MNDYFWRMSTIDSDVTDLLLAKPATVKRRAAVALARAAASANSLDEELAGPLAAMGRAAQTEDERERVRRLVDDLDRHERQMQDRFDVDEATEEEYLAAFRRARAGHAVLFALDEDPRRAALEAAYEANAAGVPVELVVETIGQAESTGRG